MSFQQKGIDPKTPLTGTTGRDSIFDRRLNEFRTTGEMSKPQRKTLDYLKKPTAEFDTPSQDSRLSASLADVEEFNELERNAFIDAGSGLLNAHTLTCKIGAEMRRSKRFKHNFSLLVIELDGFAAMEEMGPLALEFIFATFSMTLKKNIREVDLAGRVNSSTVAIICPETSMEEAVLEADRLRQVTEVTRFKQLGYKQNLTVSIGVASFPEHGEVPEDMLNATMEAMRQASAAGGNAVFTAHTATSPQKVQISLEDFSPETPKTRDDTLDMSPSADKQESHLAMPVVETTPLIS